MYAAAMSLRLGGTSSGLMPGAITFAAGSDALSVEGGNTSRKFG